MKLFLNNTINPVPYYFYACSRIGQILHTRIRTASSALNGHLYKKNIEANPYCSCKLVETSEHFLLKCSLYERLRNDLFVNLSSHLNINNLLFGDSNLPDCENESNFLVIQDFIIKSKRFTTKYKCIMYIILYLSFYCSLYKLSNFHFICLFKCVYYECACPIHLICIFLFFSFLVSGRNIYISAASLVF